MTLTYTTKRDLVQTLRRYTDWWFNFCNCGGAQPSMGDTKADQHSPECPYQQRIEHERKATNDQNYQHQPES